MYVCHLILLEKVISFTMMNNLWHIQKICNTLFQPFMRLKIKTQYFQSWIFQRKIICFVQFWPHLPQRVETVETLYYKLHLLSFWVKNPTLSQIEPYRVVVLFNLIFQSTIWLNRNIHLQNIDQIKWPLLLNSKFCILYFFVFFQSYFFFIWFEFSFGLGMGKIYGFCRVACFARAYSLLGKFKLSSGVKSSSRYISSIKCFFVLLLFGISLQCTTSGPTTGAWQWALKDANEMVWSLLPWWLVLNLTSVSK